MIGTINILCHHLSTGENENKILKQIIGPNPTMDDLTIATLVMEDVRSLNEKVQKMYPTRSNPTREAGFPNIDGCVKM